MRKVKVLYERENDIDKWRLEKDPLYGEALIYEHIEKITQTKTHCLLPEEMILEAARQLTK